LMSVGLTVFLRTLTISNPDDPPAPRGGGALKRLW